MLLFKSHLFDRIPTWFVVCFCSTFPKQAGRRELFQNGFPETVAGLALVELSPRVPGVETFRKSGHLLVCGSGSSSRKCVPQIKAASDVGLVFSRSAILLLPAGATRKISPKKSGLLWCCGRFPSAPWAWLANKFGECNQVNKRIGAVSESSNQKVSNACRGHGEAGGK